MRILPRVSLKRPVVPVVVVLVMTYVYFMATSLAMAAPEGHVAATAAAEPIAVDNLLRMTLGLLLVIGAIFATGWGLRRFGRFSSAAQGSLKIVAGLSMGSRERLVLVQVGQEQVLIGVAPGRVQTLHVLDHPIELEASGDDRGDNFAQRLRTAIKQRTAL